MLGNSQRKHRMLLHKQQHHQESANLLSYGHEFPLALCDFQSTASYSQGRWLRTGTWCTADVRSKWSMYLSSTGKKLLHADSLDSCVFVT